MAEGARQKRRLREEPANKKSGLTGDDARPGGKNVEREREKERVREGEEAERARLTGRKRERQGCTRTLEQRCWVSGEWRAPATSQRPIRTGNDVEATRRPCSRTFFPLFVLRFFLRGLFSSFFPAVAKVKLLPLLMLLLQPLPACYRLRCPRGYLALLAVESRRRFWGSSGDIGLPFVRYNLQLHLRTFLYMGGPGMEQC